MVICRAAAVHTDLSDLPVEVDAAYSADSPPDQRRADVFQQTEIQAVQ